MYWTHKLESLAGVYLSQWDAILIMMMCSKYVHKWQVHNSYLWNDYTILPN